MRDDHYLTYYVVVRGNTFTCTRCNDSIFTSAFPGRHHQAMGGTSSKADHFGTGAFGNSDGRRCVGESSNVGVVGDMGEVRNIRNVVPGVTL